MDQDDRAVGLTYRWGSSIGYTPMRLFGVGPLTSSPELPVISPRLGYGRRGAPSGYTTKNGRGMVAIVRLAFKVERPLSYFSRLFTGYHAPWAWVRLEYGVTVEGVVTYRVFSTAVPSLAVYLNGARHAAYDMMGCRDQELQGFLGAGDCYFAPSYLHLQEPGIPAPMEG
jgi:hypothetical protein